MPIEAISQTSLGPVYILSGNDDLHIGSGVTITSLDSDAVIAFTGTHQIIVEGHIVAQDDGINTIGTDTAQTVIIQAGGSITAGGDGVVDDADGVILDGIGSRLENHGSIIAYGTAASLFVRDGGTTTVINSGTMIGDRFGIWNKFGAGTLEFINTGTLESVGRAFQGNVYTDHVTNAGVIRGGIDLNGGDDLFDGRGGVVVGAIQGGDGNDRFILGNAAETVQGGFGTDELDLSYLTSSITLDLSNSTRNRGDAVLGDRYTSIENITAGSGSDRLTGNAADNGLNGGAGADTLTGGDGNDRLDGGKAKDFLIGGNGADTFVFSSWNGRGDVIADFTAYFDRIEIDAASFGYTGGTGTLSADHFVSAANNLALDADDYFIFNTTDQTLWFDRDGSGAREALIVADLQGGAVLTASDIWLV